MKWYQVKVNEVYQKLNSSATGLTRSEREQRLIANGDNKLTGKQDIKEWQKIAKHFKDLLMVILMIAGVLKAITGDYAEMIIIFTVVVINALIGYWQEKKAEESLNGISQLLGAEATVLSEGQRLTIASEKLVVGDLIVLKSGDIVPADVRLVECHQLVIEEAILTGESLPVEKSHQRLEKEATTGDQVNMAFSGTQIQSGTGIGIVVATGDGTEIGQINQALQAVPKQETPLLRKMNTLNKQIFKGLLFLSVFLIFFTTFRYGMELNLLVSAVIALIVAVVPEGLPAVLSMILSMGVNRMAKEQAIVKSMPAVETLGSMTVICSDKTGTLTQNEMSVISVITATENLKVRDNRLQNHGRLLSIMENCQDTLDEGQDLESVNGNPTEMALLYFSKEYQVPHLPTLNKFPFDSKHKYMATVHQTAGEKLLFVKGAPDVLFRFATSEENAETGQVKPFRQAFWQESASELAKQGQRVLAFGYRKLTPDCGELTHESIEKELTIVGIAGIIDPPKASAIQAVSECLAAGIQVKMITGDHIDTASAIGQQIGLKHVKNGLEGYQIDAMSDDELQRQVRTHDIFARTTPAHKLRIVTALQANGEVVGMTGDGVNDAPALKKADIGVAMGIKGSEVSKQSADMVLADDNFATISKAVKEGRRVFDNLKKTINFFLPTAVAQGLVVIVALLTNHPLPLSPIQILWLNMVTTITLSYALGFEPAHKDTMNRSPRNPQENILSAYAVFRIFYVSLMITGLGFVLMYQFDSAAVQQTILLQSIAISQAFYMINCRELSDFSLNKGLLTNRSIWVSLGILGGLQMIVIYVPMAQQIIGTTALTMEQHGLVLAIGLIIFIAVELEKATTKWLMGKISQLREASDIA